MLEHFGVNHCEQYCSLMGRPYGFLDIREREETIRVLDNDDLEAFCDDLYVRMIAGMPPCLNWSRVEPIIIEYARHSDKAGLLAYLIQRVNESQPSSDMTVNEIMDRNHRQINSYPVITALANQGHNFYIVPLHTQHDTLP